MSTFITSMWKLCRERQGAESPLPDLFDVIARTFGGAAPIYSGLCPNEQGDGDNNSVVDVFDVIGIIEYVFSNGPGPVDPCEAWDVCVPE